MTPAPLHVVGVDPLHDLTTNGSADPQGQLQYPSAENAWPIETTTFRRWVGVHLRTLRKILEPLGWLIDARIDQEFGEQVATFRFSVRSLEITREYYDPDLTRYLVRHMRRTWGHKLIVGERGWNIRRAPRDALRDATDVLIVFARTTIALPNPSLVPT